LYTRMRTPPLVVGPTLGYNATPHLTVQFEALRKSVRYDEATRLLVFSDVVDTSQTTVKGSRWEYPLTAKVRLRKGQLEPFAFGGLSFSSTKLSEKAVYTRTSSAFPDQNRSVTLSDKVTLNTNASNVAFVMGGGLGFPFRHFLMGPELRYSRWGSARPYPGWYPTVNQTDLLVVITFRR
jgi:hypothetical protein